MFNQVISSIYEWIWIYTTNDLIETKFLEQKQALQNLQALQGFAIRQIMP